MEEKGWWAKKMSDGGFVTAVKERGGWKTFFQNPDEESAFLYEESSSDVFKTMAEAMQFAEQAYKNMSRSSMAEPSLYKG